MNRCRVMKQCDVSTFWEVLGKKIPLAQFNFYQWHVFCKFTSVQQKSSLKAIWKRRKHFKRIIFLLQIVPYSGNTFISLLFSCTNWNMEKWRTFVFTSEALAFDELIFAKLRDVSENNFWENTIVLKRFSLLSDVSSIPLQY